MADPEHLRIVKEGASAIQRWKEQNKGRTLDLSGADLHGIKLDRVDLSGANLTEANLVSSFVTKSDLSMRILNERS